MKRWAAMAVLLLLLSGCAPHAQSLAEMGCSTGDEYLPELDQAHDGGLADSELGDLSARIGEELRLDYFDNETRSLFRLLAEQVRDSTGDGYTPVDVDYADIRHRLVTYCESDVHWTMDNA